VAVTVIFVIEPILILAPVITEWHQQAVVQPRQLV
jgi:hypothetical protein